MKKYLLFFIFLFFSCLCLAQTTTIVTGTIQFPDGQLFANGTVMATFTPPGGVINQNQYLINGSNFPYNVSGVMNGSGTFTITLTDDHKIRPFGGRWMFTVCSLASTPCTNSLQDVFGTSIDLSSLINNDVKNINGTATEIKRFFADTEVNTNSNISGGLMYYNPLTGNYRCWSGSTWGNCNGAGGGSTNPGGLDQYVQYNCGGSTFCGSAGLLWNNSTPQFSVAAFNAATSGGNVASPIFSICANWYNGTVSGPDCWNAKLTVAPVNSSTSRSQLLWSHIGTTGATNGPNFNFLIIPAGSGTGCNHDDVNGFTTNAQVCFTVEGNFTSGTGAVIAAVNNASSGSGRTALVNQSLNSSVWHAWISDPNNNFSSQEGARFCQGQSAACWDWFLFDHSSNPARIYFGGDAWQAGTHAAFDCGVALAGGSGSQDCVHHGLLTLLTLASNTNCAAIGTSANPSVSSCGSAIAGSFSAATNASTGTAVINTTAVTANSEIFIVQRSDTNTGTRLGVTCNSTLTTVIPEITAVTAGTSFTINLGTITTNPECFSYYIIN